MAEVRTTSSTGGQKGVKAARFDLIPAGPLRLLAEHYGRGALKYANHQWRQGYEYSKSFAALQRHTWDWLEGKSYDVCENRPDECSHVDLEGNPFEGAPTEHGSTCFNHTGSHHMICAAWHTFLIVEFEERFPEHDDRYVPTSNMLEEDESWEIPDTIEGFRPVGFESDEAAGFDLKPYTTAISEAVAKLAGPIKVEWRDPAPRFEVSVAGVATDRDRMHLDEELNGVQRAFDRR